MLSRVNFILLLLVCVFVCTQVVGFAESEDVAAYFQAIAKKCEKTYFPVQGFEACKASANFSIDCNGVISSIAVSQNPRWRDGRTSDIADRAIVEAIRIISRLPSPPNESGCPIYVQVTFDGRAADPMKITASVSGQGASSDKLQTVHRKPVKQP